MPPFATAHVFCVSWDGPRKLGFLTAVHKQRYVCVVYIYAREADLGKGYWNLKRKLGATMHFSEIIKLQYVKNSIHC